MEYDSKNILNVQITLYDLDYFEVDLLHLIRSIILNKLISNFCLSILYCIRATLSMLKYNPAHAHGVGAFLLPPSRILLIFQQQQFQRQLNARSEALRATERPAIVKP